MKILETERLILRRLVKSDSEFMLDLLNQPSFIKYIGDRNVRTLEGAEDYIESRFTKSYVENGFGLYLVELKIENSKLNTSIGICGFVKRDTLPDADIGFAFLSRFEKQGYAFESAKASMEYGEKFLDFKRVLAITTKDNKSSQKLLEKLNFKFESLIETPNNEELNLYVWETNK